MEIGKGDGGGLCRVFIDFSSAFNTIVPFRLIMKLLDLNIKPSMCNWILNFLTERPQAVRLGNIISSSLTLNTSAPQGCIMYMAV